MGKGGTPPKTKGGSRIGSGRKPSIVLARAQELDDKHGPEAYMFLVGVMRGEFPDAAMSDRVNSGKYLCDHWRGKAKERVEVTTADDASLLGDLATAMNAVASSIDNALAK